MHSSCRAYVFKRRKCSSQCDILNKKRNPLIRVGFFFSQQLAAAVVAAAIITAATIITAAIVVIATLIAAY